MLLTKKKKKTDPTLKCYIVALLDCAINEKCLGEMLLC